MASESKAKPTKGEAKKERKERRESISRVSKKAKAVQKKLKKSRFTNKSLDVSNFLNSLRDISKIVDADVLSQVEAELDKINQRGVPNIDSKSINELTKKVLASQKSKDNRTHFQKFSQKLSGLKQRLKAKNQPKGVSGIVSLRSAIEEIKYELDNAVTNGEISAIAKDGELSDYDKRLLEVSEIEDSISGITPQTSETINALIAEKGNVTRVKNKIDKALADGIITKSKHEELTNSLAEAKEIYESDVKDFIDNANAKAKEYFSNNRASTISNDYNLSKPQYILLDKLFDVFKRKNIKIDDLLLADKISKIIDAIESGYFPLKEINEVYRYVLSERNVNDVLDVIDGATKSSKAKSKSEMIRDFSATVLGFKSGKLGKSAKKSKKLEMTVYAPLIEAIEQSNQQTDEILIKFHKATKLSLWGSLNPFRKRRRRKNILLAGVYMNQLNNYLQRGDGVKTGVIMEQQDNSKIDVGSIDWLGIILGKEEAVNALEGELNEDTRKGILNGQLRREAAKSSVMDKIGLGSSDMKLLDEIWEGLPKLKDGSVDWDAFFNESSKYVNKEASSLISAANEAFSDSYEYLKAAKFIRGEGIDEVVGYYKRSRVSSSNPDIDYKTMNFSDNMRVVAGSSIDRTTQAVGVIDFNVMNTVTANAVESTKFFNFEVNGGLVNATMNKAISRTSEKALTSAIKDDARQAISYTYSSPSSSADRIASKIVSSAYVESLFRFVRLGAEFVSMFVRMPFQTGTMDIRNVFRTKTLGKLEELSGIRVTPQQSAQVEQGAMSSMRKRSRKSLNAVKRRGAIDLINMAMGSAEILLRGGYIYPLFLKNFTMITGEVFDSNKLSDPDYIEDYRQAITDAMAVTKIENGKIYPTGNKFAERRKVKLIPIAKVGYVNADSAEGRILNYMSTFVFKESEMLFESAKYTLDAMKEHGFTVKAGKEAMSQVFASRETVQAMGVLIGGFTYSYITGLEYLLAKIWDDEEDDEEKKRARDLTKSQYGLEFDSNGDFKSYNFEEDMKGSVDMIKGQSSFFFIGRYGQGTRILSILGLSGIHSTTENKELKKEIETFLSGTMYTRPLNFNQYSVDKFAAENIPVVHMSAKVVVDLAKATKDAHNLALAAEKGELKEDEKVFLRSFDIAFKYINAALMTKGTRIPESKNISKEIKQELEKGSKKKSKGRSDSSWDKF